MVDPQSNETTGAPVGIERLALCPDCREAIQTLVDEMHDGLIQRIIAAKMVVEGQLAHSQSLPPSTNDLGDIQNRESLEHDLASIAKWLDESLLEGRLILDQLQLAANHEPLSILIDCWAQRLKGRVVIDNQLAHNFDDVSPDVRRNLARVFQTIIGNLLQHSDADRLELNGERNKLENIIEFRDNGSGRMSEVKPGVGLAAVERRMQSLGGTLSLLPESSGFCVRITWPQQEPDGDVFRVL